MNYLLDTCFISELRKPEPKQSVTDWFSAVDEHCLYISALTIGEIRYGIALLTDDRKKKDLQAWLSRIEESFAELILPVDEIVAKKWGDMRACLQAKGVSISVVDGLLAATCYTNRLTLVTRNEKDFSATGIDIINPWS
jgi:toxin FitB